ncbi:MAG: hypothetical protein WAM60_10930 [Candidatus Promineifilaceae bacterium]
MPEQSNDWKIKTLILGTLVGALIGLGTGYLLTRTAEENGGSPPKITTGDAIKASVGIIGVVRGIIALGDRK